MLYGRTATFDFVHADDADLIEGNRAFLSDLTNLPRAFTRSYFEVEGETVAQKTYYRPVAIASFMIDAAFGGSNPRVYHATNVVLHAAAACLLMALALSWGAARWAALAAALVFAVHPVNVQTVAWIAGRNDLLMTVFGLLSLLAWSRARLGFGIRDLGFGLCHSIAFALALFSKEIGLFFPAIAVLHQRLVLREKPGRAQWIALGCDAAIVIAWGVLRAKALAGMPSELSGETLTVVASNAPQVLVHLRKMFVPVFLNVAPGVYDRDLLLAAVTLVVLAIAASRWWSGPLRALAAAWVLLFLVPTLAVPGLPVYEHRAYLPLVGILLVGAIAVTDRNRLRAPRFAGPPKPPAEAEGPPRIVVGYVGAVILVFVTLTYHRQEAFRDAFAYWTDATRDARFGPIAHVNLGQLYEAADRPREARREYLRALERDPNTPKAHNNLGVVLMKLDEPDLALAHFREETERHPWNADGWFNLALWMETRGQSAAARKYYERAIEVNPSYAPAYEKLGRLPPK